MKDNAGILGWWNNRWVQAHYGVYFKRHSSMKRIIDVKFDFTKNAEIVDWNAAEIQEYRRVFKRVGIGDVANL